MLLCRNMGKPPPPSPISTKCNPVSTFNTNSVSQAQTFGIQEYINTFDQWCLHRMVYASHTMNFREGPHFKWRGPQTYWPATTHTHHPYHMSQVLWPHCMCDSSTDHSQVLRSSVVPLPRDWKHRSSGPHQTWPRIVESDVASLNVSSNDYCLSSSTKSTGMEGTHGNKMSTGQATWWWWSKYAECVKTYFIEMLHLYIPIWKRMFFSITCYTVILSVIWKSVQEPGSHRSSHLSTEMTQIVWSCCSSLSISGSPARLISISWPTYKLEMAERWKFTMNHQWSPQTLSRWARVRSSTVVENCRNSYAHKVDSHLMMIMIIYTYGHRKRRSTGQHKFKKHHFSVVAIGNFSRNADQFSKFDNKHTCPSL